MKSFKIKYQFLLLFGFISNCSILFAQNDYTIQHFTQKNGLPQNSVNQLYFDKHYFLWVATESGIVRFDGINFYTFDNKNTPTIVNDRFRWIFSTPNKKQFTSNADGKLFEIIDNQIKQVPSQNNAHNLPYIFGGIPNLEHLLFIKNDESNITKNWQNFPNTIIPENENNFYVLGFQYIYKFRNHELIDSLNITTFGKILYFFKIQHNYYLINDIGNVFHVNLAKKIITICRFKNSEILNKNNFKIIFKAQAKRTFLLNDNRVFVLKHIEHNPTLLDGSLITTQIPPRIDVSDIEYNDSLKIIAVGSKTQGLYIFKPKLFTNQQIVNSNKEVSNTFYAIAKKNDSTVFSTLQYEFINDKVQKATLSSEPINLESIYITKNKKIYFGVGFSLFVNDLVTKKTSLVKVFDEVITCINGSGDSIWIGGNKAILLLVNDKITKLNLATRVQCIYIDSIQRVYFSNCNGLHQIEIKKQSITYKTIIGNACIRDIYLHGKFLFATSYGNGLFVVYNGKVFKLPHDKNNYLSKCHSIQIDSLGKVWISTNSGIFQTVMRRIISFVNDTTQVYQYHYFDEQNGIENSEFNGGCYPASVKLSNGKIYFPSMNGLVSFNPRNFVKRVYFKSIFIDKIEVDNEQIPISKQIILEPGVENLSLYLSSPFWYNSYEVSYQYQLLGFNSNLVDIKDARLPINFTNLSHGEYTLLIKKNGGNQYFDAQIRISIIVLKKYYQTWWFATLVIFVFMLLTVFIVIFYNKILLQQNVILENKVGLRTAELALINTTLQDTNTQLVVADQINIRSINLKQKLIAILSHDIITPLKFISMVARNSGKVNSEHEYQTILNEIDNTSKKLYNNAQNILNWIKYQSSLISVEKSNVALFSIVDDVSELLDEIVESKQNKIINNIDPDLIIFTDKNILSIVIHNLITNAVKYNSNTHIEITSETKNGFYLISVKDDGKGISKANLDRINEIKNRQNAHAIKDNNESTGIGFIIITELLNILNGTFQIDSNENGTIINIAIPI